ncbi:MAG: site-2 protease family protein, partial [Spirochaetaceae bacterium]|nr:site-2 protease family protein [Spirochaetaceae bacterium]
MILTIFLGLVGLGLVVLVHELGHFAAARAVGVEVEAFSIGWGPKLFSWKRSRTEWRLSAFPIGGYCRMKGEEAFRQALADKSESIPRDPGTFYGASPLRRILISVSGPVANVLFAAVVAIAVAAVGYSVPSYDNRIVLASEFSLDGKPAPTGLPADLAGLKSGDRVVAIDGKPVRDYADLQEAIALS